MILQARRDRLVGITNGVIRVWNRDDPNCPRTLTWTILKASVCASWNSCAFRIAGRFRFAPFANIPPDFAEGYDLIKEAGGQFYTRVLSSRAWLRRKRVRGFLQTMREHAPRRWAS